LRSNNHAKLSNIPVHASGSDPDGKFTCDTLPVVTGAVVPTVTVTDWFPLPVICTEELDKPQVGAGLTTGVMAQLRFTVPVNPAEGVMTKLNLALCPAFMVCEVGDPEAAPIAKSGAA
jgi:hypothetical protein